MAGTYKLPDDAMLLMTWYEAGILRGALEKNKMIDEVPRSLRLKLDILFSQAYLSHPTFGKQAKIDIENYRKELKTIEGKGTI